MAATVLHLLVIVCFCNGYVAGSTAEYDLRTVLFKNYNPTVVPVKDARSAVQVKFDLALRSILELNEKSQSLQMTAWIRIRWKDEFLTWNPKNHSGVDSINVSPGSIWIPDIVLYNSADAKSKGLVYEAMETQLKISSDGSVSWFCPMILKSECSVALADFPFDSQTCPLTFGLWTYDSLRVNLSLVRDTGDLSAYLRNGIFILHGMPVSREVIYYSCCPDVPYARLTYQLFLQRKTVFYLLNFVFPGVLLAVLSFLNFLLPPESGERIGLCITNLLSLIFLMLLVSQKIPSTSASVPIINVFLTAVVAVNAVTLIASAVTIKFLFFTGESSASIPWTVQILINKHIGNFLRMNCCRKSCLKKGSDASNYRLPPAKNAQFARKTMDLQPRYRASLSETSSPDLDVNDEAVVPGPSRNPTKEFKAIRDGLNIIVGEIKKTEATSDYQGEWRQAVKVIDRLLCILLALVTIATAIYIVVKVPKLYVR